MSFFLLTCPQTKSENFLLSVNDYWEDIGNGVFLGLGKRLETGFILGDVQC